LQAASVSVQEIEVEVENDHIERLATAKPILALSELIWNAYDADASSVRVQFEEGDLTRLALIRIEDDGDGIPFDDAEGLFKSLGGSWKRNGAKTSGWPVCTKNSIRVSWVTESPMLAQ
jgi:signal transduction histidine kinase